MPAVRTVHVVDDDVAVRRSLERLLDAAGLRAVSYASPLDFLHAAAGLSGCVLLDIRMRELDGLEVQARLLERGISLPVIIMTGEGDVAGAVRAMKAGAVDFIEKPYDDDALLRVIEAALSSQRATAAETVRNVHTAVLEASGGELEDDATAVCLAVGCPTGSAVRRL